VLIWVQASRLKYLAETFRLAVLVTNQVTTQISSGPSGGGGAGGLVAASTRCLEGRAHTFCSSKYRGWITRAGGGHLTAALGTLWAHAVNTRLVLESVQGDRSALSLWLVSCYKSSFPN
jgi:RAD51-like protein 1